MLLKRYRYYPINEVPSDKLASMDAQYEWFHDDSGDVNWDSYMMGLLHSNILASKLVYLDTYIQSEFRVLDLIAKQSPCSRAKIACSISPIGEYQGSYSGYNDIPGKEEVCITDCKEEIGCQPDIACRLTRHAEMRALNSLPRDLDKFGYIMFCSSFPCLDCMKACLARNVKYVIAKNGRPQPEYDRPALSYLTLNSDIVLLKYDSN